MALKELVICTYNEGKQREISTLLAQKGIRLWTPHDFPGMPDPVEDGDSFVANARIKAQSSWEFTQRPSLADDSGLEVEALGGEPGIYSARYAGVSGPQRDEANRRFLLQKMESVPDDQRGATFRCVLVLCLSPTEEFVFEGRCPGRILRQEQGENGFGYDPLFFFEEAGMTLAQMEPAQKNRISHRARALASFEEWLAL